jgi:hypothetical protein
MPSTERLNRDCRCVSLDRRALAAAFESELLGQPGLYALVQQRNPHLFAAGPVFVGADALQRIDAVVAAAQRATALPGWRAAVLADAPAAARRDPGNAGAFLGFDFHLEAGALSLIEINTNPGGALLSTALARAQRACCEEMRSLVPSAAAIDGFEADIVRMFVDEWQAAGRGGLPGCIAIVDDDPAGQYLYAEFLLFQRLFERAGMRALIVDPQQLRVADGRLRCADQAIDLVYNRLTDFALDEARDAALRQAWDEDRAVLAPHPRAHALWADKRNLALLGDALFLRDIGLAAADAELLAAHVPRTEIVSPANAERLWRERRTLFFKPWAGYGSRAAYRGAKLTRGVWAGIVAGRYVAQTLAPPGERHVAGPDAAAAPELTPLKFDLRAFARAGRVQWLSARLYRGQTTNFRTPGGGFAPVFAAPAGFTLPTGVAGNQPRPIP